MRHQLLLFLSIGIFVFFALLNVHIPTSSITGAATQETEPSYASTLHHVVTDFFGDSDIDFPDGGCGDIARELYGNIAYTQLDTTAGYGTTGPSRLATLNFVIDRTSRYGTLDMAKGKDLIHDRPADSFISISTETIVRVPKETRTTYYSMDLYGVSDNEFIVTSGSFSTPSVDCTFITRDSRALCDCSSHSITGIRIAGITGLRPVKENI